MREIRTLRATWRGLETWCGSGPPAHTGAPALDPTDERGRETERCRMAQATAPILDSTERCRHRKSVFGGKAENICSD